MRFHVRTRWTDRFEEAIDSDVRRADDYGCGSIKCNSQAGILTMLALNFRLLSKVSGADSAHCRFRYHSCVDPANSIYGLAMSTRRSNIESRQIIGPLTEIRRGKSHYHSSPSATFFSFSFFLPEAPSPSTPRIFAHKQISSPSSCLTTDFGGQEYHNHKYNANEKFGVISNQPQ